MRLLVLATFACLVLFTQAAEFPEQYEGPAIGSDPLKWFNDLKAHRDTVLKSINYTKPIFDVPSLQWTQTSYIQPQIHTFDRFMYNVDTHSYTLDKFMTDLYNRYGGVDAMLVWPTYPNIGIDNRNQYDLIRSMPGGLAAWKNITAQLHSKNIKVMWPYNPWDQGTRKEGVPDSQALTELIISVDGDGFNGDTMLSIPKEFYDHGISKGKHLALEPEWGGNPASLHYTPLAWGYWKYPHVPSVNMFKFLEPKRLTHVCNRWAKDHINDLQFAFFNGDGFESWENVWGVWNGITPRDGAAINRVARMLRFFGKLGFLQSRAWHPHYPLNALSSAVFASMFPHPTKNEVVWFLVNRNETSAVGPILAVTQPHAHYYDCYHGVRLEAQTKNNHTTLNLNIGALSFGCVYATNTSFPALESFLAEMKRLTAVPLSNLSKEWKYLPQKMVPLATTPKPSEATLKNMAHIPAANNYHFVTSGTEIEGDSEHGVDVQFSWESHPQKKHDHVMNISSYYIDIYPVTNANYLEYVKASKYVPRDTHNYLKDWKNGTYPSGWDKKPVTWVSLKEAHEYCKFYGKRLPHVWEWQYAAQGNTGNEYPWGNTKDQTKYPTQHKSRDLSSPSDVDAHCAAAKSPFGVCDLVGNVWQYTDEFQDDHTRAVLLKGSSYYVADYSSGWYFPHALEVNLHSKYLLMDDSYERAGTLGFRCVVDAATA